MERGPWNAGRAVQLRIVPAEQPPGQIKATVINGTLLVAEMTATPEIIESSLVLLLQKLLRERGD